MIGETVGNFEIISHLGKGGMGSVFLAQQKAIKTKVAIKVLQADVSKNTKHVQRLFNEAVAVGEIHHSGILKIFDVGFLPGGEAYLVMEYLEGETLTSRIKRRTRLGIAEVADFGRQIASVLEATHTAGITHRDLKPDNIYLVRDEELVHGERVKVLDFGMAKLVIPSTIGSPRMTASSASSVGTPNYMSPEQWHSLAEADWRTDAYALGCVAFEMACGRPPFVGESMADICARHLNDVPPVPSVLVPGLPRELDRLIARLLEKEPQARPTMREAMQVFSELGRGEGIALTTLQPSHAMLSPFVRQPAAPPSQSAQLVAAPPKSRRLGVVVGISAIAIAGTVGAAAILATRGPSTPDTGSAGNTRPASAPANNPADARKPDAAPALDAAVATRDAQAAAAKRPATPPPRVPESVAPTPESSPGSAVKLPDRLSRSQIARAVRARTSACKGTEGAVTVTLAIAADGTIATATMTQEASVGEAVVRCVGDAVNKAVFPHTRRGGEASVTIEFGERDRSPGSNQAPAQPGSAY